MKNKFKFIRTVVLLSSSALVLGACNTLSELGRTLDPPFSNNQSDRAIAQDQNGVTTYAGYQTVNARDGDTVQTVADRIGMNSESLAHYNGLQPQDSLTNGQILVIPPNTQLRNDAGLEQIATEALDQQPARPTVPLDQDGTPIHHVVKAGDTAYSIARRYNVSVTALASWNGLDSNLTLRVGQRLLIPSGGIDTRAATSPATPAPKKRKPAQKKVQKSPKVEPDPAPAPAKESRSNAVFIAPVDGPVLRPFSKKSGGNEGVDYQVPTGTSVRAAAAGSVALISKSVNDTSIVLLRHGNNLYSVYSNLNAVTLKKGDRVQQGQALGKVAGGNPPYVHFEIRKGTEAVDPAPYL